MTKEESVKLYLDAYKASAKQAADYKLPEGFVQGPTKYDMKPAPPKPLPKPDYNKGFIKSPKTEYQYGTDIVRNYNNKYEKNRTWEDPNKLTVPDTTTEWNARRATQNQAIDAYNRYLKNRVEPLVHDSYDYYAPRFNMSREAMIRRINALKRQQGRDARLREATLGY